MKKRYQQPAMCEVKILHQQRLLAGSEPYNVRGYTDGGTETASDDTGW